MEADDAAQRFAEALQAKDHAKAEELLVARPALASADGPGGMSLLMLAIYHRAQPLVHRLLAAGAAVDTPEAAALGDTARLRELAAADPSRLARPGADGFPPLHLAAHFGHRESVQALLDLGADVAQRSTNALENTALHAAAAGGAETVVELLVEEGAPVDARDAQGNTPLMVAAANGLVASVRLFLAKGADPRAANAKGQTPLDVARERGQHAVAALLQA